MTIYSLDILLSQLGTSPLFHVQFQLLLLHLHTDFSGGRLGGLVFTSFEEFSTVFVIYTVKVFVVINKAEDVFLEFSCFFYDPTDGSNLISGSSAFSKSTLYIWTFSAHMLLKRSLQDFECYLARMWNEYNFLVVWTLFGTSLLWDWDENWPFLVLWPLLGFPNLLAYWVQQFNSIIF